MKDYLKMIYFLQVTQLIGTLNGASEALPLSQVAQNIAVDFAVVALSAALFRFDSANKESEIAQIAKGGVKIKRLSQDEMVLFSITILF